MTILVALITMIYSNGSNIWQQTGWYMTCKSTTEMVSREVSRALRNIIRITSQTYLLYHKCIFHITHVYFDSIYFILFIYDIWLISGMQPEHILVYEFCDHQTGFTTAKRVHQQGLNIRRTYPGRTLKNVFLAEVWKRHAAVRVLRPQNGF